MMPAEDTDLRPFPPLSPVERRRKGAADDRSAGQEAPPKFPHRRGFFPVGKRSKTPEYGHLAHGRLARGVLNRTTEHEAAMPIRRILVATDFSQASDAAVARAREIAVPLGASLCLLHVFEDDSFVTSAVATERLAKTVEAGLGHRTALVTGPVASAIVEYADGHAFDLIVMGTHGRTGVAHLLLGSVAERVVRTATCPVLTVRQEPVPVTSAATLAVPEPLYA